MADLKVYKEEEVRQKLATELPGWQLEEGLIQRLYKTDGWQTTLMLVNSIGYLAEMVNHHPDLTVTWGKVWVKLQTHAVGGLTDMDFALAKKIEEVVLWQPGQESVFKSESPKKRVHSD